jgi:hypothetical protein
MPHVTVADDTYRRLSKLAAALNMSVDELVKPALDRLAEAGPLLAEPPLPLTGDAWRAELEAWKRDAESRAGRYPRDSSSTIVERRSTASGKTPSFDPPRHQHPAPVRQGR